jgi:hypothetical protein
MAEIDLTDLDNFAADSRTTCSRSIARSAGLLARADREHARRRRLLVGRDVCRRARGAARSRDLLLRARRQPPYGGTLIQDLPVAGRVLNMMDDPRHARIRALVSRGFTPRMIRRIEDDARQRVRGMLDA